jgi:transporter family-2 protein
VAKGLTLARHNEFIMSRALHISRPLAATIAVVVGVLVALQSRINGQLTVRLHGDGIFAATISFGTGLLLLAVVMMFSTRGRSAFADLPRYVRSKQLRPWELFGGLGGATLVASQSIVVPHTGVAPYTISTVAGQTANSVVVDRLGLAPGGRRPVTWQRVVAAVLATSAVAIAVLGRSGGHSVSLYFVLFPLLAGALIAVQQAFNAKVAVTTGAPLTATFLNFVVGFGALVAVLGIEHLISGKPLATPPTAAGELWIYLGGPIGALFIAGASVAVAPLGVLVFGLFSIIGQLLGALTLDLFVPTAGAHVGWQTFVAIGVTASAVALASLTARTASAHTGSRK